MRGPNKKALSFSSLNFFFYLCYDINYAQQQELDPIDFPHHQQPAALTHRTGRLRV